jgi:TadE-like protein
MRALSTRRPVHRSEEGQAMVEFALVLPILLLLVMGIIQFGIVFNNYVTLTDGVRAGARQAAVSRTLADPVTAARQVLGRGSRRGQARHHRHAAQSGRRNGYLGAGRRRDGRGEVPVLDQALRGRRHGRQAQEQDDRARRIAQITFCSGRGAARANRPAESGAGSTNGSFPSTRSRTTSPTAGACRKPCPENPVA